MKVRKLMIMAVLCWGGGITEGQAVDNLIFKGKLIVPDCTVNNGNPVETNFGDIEIQTLAAANTGYHWENIRVPVHPLLGITKNPADRQSGCRGS
ncbi:hypothetical protein ACLBOM_36395 [Escherichia coli]